MANTYSQIYIQIVFAVRMRRALILNSWEEELYKYISGIIKNKGQKLLAINGMPDHIQILIEVKPISCLSDLVREVKKSSTEYIIENKFSKFKFQWQEGFGAFSYNHSQIKNVINYILNQKEHHKKKKFQKEFTNYLKKYETPYKEEYLFDFIDK